MSKFKWAFPTTDGGEETGFQDPLIEYFQGDHEKFIAREAIQNSIDARQEQEKPVQMIFEKSEIPVSDFPGKAELVDKMRACLQYVNGQERPEEFFASAIEILSGKKINYLKISDSNTSGLTGEDRDREGGWFRLVKAAGINSMKGVGGGAFGIGKGAPFAASALRTVFYSTKNLAGGCAFQGKARLVSHLDDKKDVRQGVGFYGMAGQTAVRELDDIPDVFRRKTQGTDIYIMGYEVGDDWADKLAKSVLDSFWLSIWHGDLQVQIKGKGISNIVLQKDNLKESLDKFGADEAACFFQAMSAPTKVFEEHLSSVGKISLSVRKCDGYPSLVMFARKPKMVVKKKPYRVLREPYAAVFLCDNDDGNRILRDLEPPAHDDWNKDRTTAGPAVLKELDNFVRDKLRSLGEITPTEDQDIPGLEKYLPDNGHSEDTPSNEGHIFADDEAIKNETGRELGARKDKLPGGVAKVLRRASVFKEVPGRQKHQGVKKTKAKRRVGPEGPEDGVGLRLDTTCISFRSFAEQSGRELNYNFVIKAHDDAKGAIRIIAVGDDADYPVSIVKALDSSSKKIQTEGAFIKDLSFKKGEVARLLVKLAVNKKYALGIEQHGG